MKTVSAWHLWLWCGVRWSVGAVFLYAGLVKAREPQGFADSIAAFRMLPMSWINPLALGLPPLEILTGGWLLIGRRTRVAALAACLMSAVFTVALAVALARGLQVDCGCFGGGGAPSRLKTVLSLGRDLLLLAGTALLYRRALQTPR